MDLTKASLLAHCMGHYKRGGIDEKITYVDHAMAIPWSLLDLQCTEVVLCSGSLYGTLN